MSEASPTSSQNPKVRMPSSAAVANDSNTQYQFRHFPQLDGFRGLAVFFVVFGHYLECAGFSPVPTAIGHALATSGVFLFFVLSGFLITGLLQRERQEKGEVYLKRFYIRRALRLAPALLLFLLAMVLLWRLRLIEDLKGYELIACLLYARNFFGKSLVLSHIWSLSLEEQFYLCWPGIFKLLRRNWALPVALSLTTLIAIWRGFAIHFGLFNYGRGIFYMRPYFRFDSILIGACLALGLAMSARFLHWAIVFSKSTPAIALWFLLTVWTYFGEAWSKPTYLTIQMLLIVAILCQLIVGGSALSQSFFKNGVLRYLGKISYSLYLWQQIFLVIKSPSWGLLREFPINVAMAVGIAILSFHFVESPALRLKKHFE